MVEFRVDEVVEIEDALPLRWRFTGYSPFNPARRTPEEGAPRTRGSGNKRVIGNAIHYA